MTDLFLHTMPMATARSTSDGACVVIMLSTSGFVDYIMFYSMASMGQKALGAKSAIYDFLVAGVNGA